MKRLAEWYWTEMATMFKFLSHRLSPLKPAKKFHMDMKKLLPTANTLYYVNEIAPGILGPSSGLALAPSFPTVIMSSHKQKFSTAI
jgi:hypothetical protein